MAIYFQNAPLIEVIVELRWGVAFPFPSAGMMGTTGPHFQINLEASQGEEFFMSFGAECGARGLERAERIVPQGFPVIPGQVVYRFRSKDRANQNLLQVGPGVFTVNALPPYKGWESFEKLVGQGIDALLAARPDADATAGFTSVNVRFINGFGPEYFEGTSRISFLRSLGFVLQVPKELENVSKQDETTFFNLNYITGLEGGAKLQINLGEGAKDGLPIQVVELGATYENVDATPEALLSVINTSHDMIEKIFMDMTTPIHALMKPVEA
jgi:uncharacterized protein (TIGR04255 family)